MLFFYDYGPRVEFYKTELTVSYTSFPWFKNNDNYILVPYSLKIFEGVLRLYNVLNYSSRDIVTESLKLHTYLVDHQNNLTSKTKLLRRHLVF